MRRPLHTVAPARTIEITEDHLRLIRNLRIDPHARTPTVDSHRPFGEEPINLSIAKILGWEIFEDEHGDKHLTRAQAVEATRLMNEVAPALAAVLYHGEFKTGTYVCRDDEGPWTILVPTTPST